MTRHTLAFLACLLALASFPGSAGALTIGSFETSRTGVDGTPATQAGAHPNLTAAFAFGELDGAETAKSVTLGTPTGLFVSPGATPRCAAAAFGEFECPPSTQVGLIVIRAGYEGDPSHLMGTAPVYALASADGELARLGFVIPTAKLAVAIPVTVRSTSDYGLDFTLVNLPQVVPLAGAELTLWGAPADPAHDSQRFPAGSAGAPAGCPGVTDTSCLSGSTAVSVQATPLLHSPTTCQATITSALHVTTDQSSNALAASANMIGSTGCNHNAFGPTLLGGLTTAETRSTSGLTLELQVIDEGFFDPSGIAQAQVKSVSLGFPVEVEFDPDAATELGACADDQFGLGSMTPDTCPTNSEIGTFAMTVAGIEPTLEGTAHLGTPEPNGDQRLLLTAVGAVIDAKLIGLLKPGSAGAPVTVALSELPQLPLEELELQLAPETGLLLTPLKCGTYEAKSTLMPWSAPGAPALMTSSAIALTSTGPGAGPCPGPAAAVELALSPPSILATGNSTTVATAIVVDAGEIAVPGDDVVFSSTDPDQRIGAVTDNEDGTYTATITSSTKAGTATITATDATVGSDVFGRATLTQIAVSSPPPPTALTPVVPASPVARITRKPPRRTTDRTPTFHFTSNQPRSSFRCKLDRKPFRPCASPKTFPRLAYGPHTFRVRVRVVGPAGPPSSPIAYKFTVLKPRAS